METLHVCYQYSHNGTLIYGVQGLLTDAMIVSVRHANLYVHTGNIIRHKHTVNVTGVIYVSLFVVANTNMCTRDYQCNLQLGVLLNHRVSMLQQC